MQETRGGDVLPVQVDVLGAEGRNAAGGDRPAVGRAEQVAVLLGIVDREPAIGGIRAQCRQRRAQVTEPVRRQVRGRPQEPLPGGEGSVTRVRTSALTGTGDWRVGVPLDPVQQRRLADPLDRCGFCRAPPRLPAHLMLKERAHPQPRALAAERNRRSDKAPAVDTAAGSQDSAQPPRRLFEQACLPLLEVIDPDRQPPPGFARHVHDLPQSHSGRICAQMTFRPFRAERPTPAARWRPGTISSPRPLSASPPASAGAGWSGATVIGAWVHSGSEDRWAWRGGARPGVRGWPAPRRSLQQGPRGLKRAAPGFAWAPCRGRRGPGSMTGAHVPRVASSSRDRSWPGVPCVRSGSARCTAARACSGRWSRRLCGRSRPGRTGSS